MSRWVVAGGVAAASLLGAGCASLPPRPAQPTTVALADTADTALGRALALRLAQHPGESVFYPLTAGADAFALRVALARTAQRSLDIQYYIFDADDTGLTLLAEIMAAADRGVRVRLLLDDLHTSGQDKALAAIDAHPNVEVRLFNPFANRGVRLFEFITDFRRVDRRMHNKSMTADNQLTVVGGRNVGDAYFAATTDLDFSDLDLLAAGPVVPQVSAVFDDYWNAEAAWPLVSVARPLAADETAALQQQVRQHLDDRRTALRATPYGKALLESGVLRAMQQEALPAFWGRATVIADRAAKVTLPPHDDSTHAIPELINVLNSAQHDLTLISPYFVPGDPGMAWLSGLQKRGVQVHLLTNSFGATDVRAVHAGYAPRREALLKDGVLLYELKPSAYAEMVKEKKRHGPGGSSRASLHAKSYMVDRRLLFIGSLNLDPRSARLNTEMGIVVDSAPLCAMLGKGLDDALLDAAYQVVWLPDPRTGQEGLAWITREDGVLRTYYSEPDMSGWNRFGQGVLRLLPVESEL
ncbi:phospholipase D family protein [Cupriavidus campinensis]